MPTYGQPTPAHLLFDKIVRQSSDFKERLALLNHFSKESPVTETVISEVRDFLWADYKAKVAP